MAKLVKIKDITLSTTIRRDEGTTLACNAAKYFLGQQGIPYTELWYNDADIDEHTAALEALSTWTWKDGVTRTLTDMPVLHWTECYDDWSTQVDHAMGLDEIRRCSLIANKNLI